MQVAAHDRAALDVAGSKHLRVAVGAYRGSPLKKVGWVALILGVVAGVTGIALANLGWTVEGEMLVPGFFVAFLSIFYLAFVPPYASRAGIAAEQTWLTTRGFQLFGYLEALSAEPEWSCRIILAIKFQDPNRRPEQGLLSNVLGGLDPGGQVASSYDGGYSFTSSSVSGATGISVNRVPVYRNHRLPAHVHKLIDGALVVVHRSFPIGSVTISRS